MLPLVSAGYEKLEVNRPSAPWPARNFTNFLASKMEDELEDRPLEVTFKSPDVAVTDAFPETLLEVTSVLIP
jgi:hypothetical protein